jgi:hypothetical protein
MNGPESHDWIITLPRVFLLGSSAGATPQPTHGRHMVSLQVSEREYRVWCGLWVLGGGGILDGDVEDNDRHLLRGHCKQQDTHKKGGGQKERRARKEEPVWGRPMGCA